MTQCLSVEEVAAELGVSPRRAKLLIYEGRLPARWDGKQHVVARKHLARIHVGPDERRQHGPAAAAVERGIVAGKTVYLRNRQRTDDRVWSVAMIEAVENGIARYRRVRADGTLSSHVSRCAVEYLLLRVLRAAPPGEGRPGGR